MGSPIRILHVLGNLNRGGAETMVMNLYRHIDREIMQFDFVVHTNDECAYDKEVKELGGVIFRLPQYKGTNHFQYIRAWKCFFKENTQYRIIHSHIRSTASIFLKIAKSRGLVTIIHSHSTSSDGNFLEKTVKNYFQKSICENSDYFFACSKDSGKWLFGDYILNSQKFYILKNAIDLKEFAFDNTKRENIRREFNLDNSFVIGHIGRFHESKNHVFLIEIFREFHKINNRTKLLLVGEGKLRLQIEKLVEKYGLKNDVIFTGVRPDVSELMQAMDVFVFPSLYEGLGIVAVESQAAGLPTIVADTIPREAAVTDLFESISLNDSIAYWAREILQHQDKNERRNTSKEIINSGYDIKDTSNWLQKFYLNL